MGTRTQPSMIQRILRQPDSIIPFAVFASLVLLFEAMIGVLIIRRIACKRMFVFFGRT